MGTHYWLMKTEPETFSFEDLIRDKKTSWDGVRNYQARNNLKRMKNGDQVLIYHSVKRREVVGIAEVIREAYPDTTENTPAEKGWVMVDVKPIRVLKRPVTLDEIKKESALKDIALIRQSRLSVMPLLKSEFDLIKKRGESG